jgi:hypothetical protein
MIGMRHVSQEEGAQTSYACIGDEGIDVNSQIKCDAKQPKCTHCTNYKTECIFTQVEKKRNPPKGFV